MQVAFLLFMSGLCALSYQTVWLREFRLIFGASTPASAAVLAIFMGGLGVGSAVLGRRADAHPLPLVFYGQLELLIAASAALTPVLVGIAREAYLRTGGSTALGMAGATFVRLLLAAMVMGVPSIVMGGTLPAAARAAVTGLDVNRHKLALAYGANTLGAVTGAFLATFFVLERCGNAGTLWMSCFVNAAVALTALRLGSSTLRDEDSDKTVTATVDTGSVEPSLSFKEHVNQKVSTRNLVLASAGISGFAFFLMELVWYRMLAPLLGGSVFTFGLILAMALLGIGVGGLAYAFCPPKRAAPIHILGLTFGCEAACLAIPLALGDSLALLALSLRRFASGGFHLSVISWAIVAGIVILPAAVVAGFQFPALLASLGRGRTHLGMQVGMAYAWNTMGAIAGSLAGGFGLLPMLSAPGAWRAAVVLLALTSIATLVLGWRSQSPTGRNSEEAALLQPGAGAADGRGNESSGCGGYDSQGRPLVRGWGSLLVRLGVGSTDAPRLISYCVAIAACVLVVFPGPTAVWRHSSIGIGRADQFSGVPVNQLRDQVNFWKRTLVWEQDGVESSIAITADKALSFLVNGKNDGNARTDAGTSVMSGLLGAALHPNPARAFVIGLGTGCTAGWIGAVESIQKVEVAELEPAVMEVARASAAVNQGMLENPKVRVAVGDAREILAVARDHYDLVVSEPSNPYRAGVASLYTREFYRTVAGKLSPNGLFLQWVQAYEIDPSDIENACATLVSVFPVVETWHMQGGDLLFVCALAPICYDVGRLRTRLGQEPFRSALAGVWRANDLEGFLAHYLSSNQFAQEIAGSPGRVLNTDDRTAMEFNCGRAVARRVYLDARQWLARSASRNLDRPLLSNGEIDWNRLQDGRASMYAIEGLEPPPMPTADPGFRHRMQAKIEFVRNNFAGALAAWQTQDGAPRDLLELLLLAEAMADTGDERATEYARELRGWQPIEADVVVARLRWRQGRLEDATAALERAFEGYRTNPWPLPLLMYRALELAQTISRQSPNSSLTRRLHAALREPFAVRLWDQVRAACRFNIALDAVDAGLLRQSIESFEPHVPWRRNFLQKRALCYEFLGDRRAARARRDLDAFLRREPQAGVSSR